MGIALFGLVLAMLAFGCANSGDVDSKGQGGTSGGGSGGSFVDGGGGWGANAGGAAGQGAGGAAGGAGSAGAGGGQDCPTGLPGPKLTSVPSGPGSTSCIDSTEVTNAQYQVFLTESPTLAQPAACAFNTSFAPVTSGNGCGAEPYNPTTRPNHPVVCVDWCDAWSYCNWAGKRLCGRIGGGSNAYADFADATKSEWFNACSAGGVKKFPYGDSLSGQSCNGTAAPGNDVVPVQQMSACEGGYPGIWDMSGNASEWEDCCQAETGASDDCRRRGGAFNNDSGDGLKCSATPGSMLHRGVAANVIGFRCCTD